MTNVEPWGLDSDAERYLNREMSPEERARFLERAGGDAKLGGEIRAMEDVIARLRVAPVGPDMTERILQRVGARAGAHGGRPGWRTRGMGGWLVWGGVVGGALAATLALAMLRGPVEGGRGAEASGAASGRVASADAGVRTGPDAAPRTTIYREGGARVVPMTALRPASPRLSSVPDRVKPMEIAGGAGDLREFALGSVVEERAGRPVILMPGVQGVIHIIERRAAGVAPAPTGR